MTDLRIPDGALVLLVGAAGVGKSTLAARHFPPDAVLSSDAFRARFGVDAADQSVTRRAFAALHLEAEQRLARGVLTVIDATNVTRAARVGLVRRAERHGAPVFAIVLDLPAELVHRRNAERGATAPGGRAAAMPGGRTVPWPAVQRQLEALAVVGNETLRAEGVVQVLRLTTPAEVDALRLWFGPQP